MSWATLVIVVVSSLVVSYVGQTVMATDSGRLPDDTEPLSYKLTMEPSLYKEFNASFTGSVDIQIAVRSSTSAITLNSKDLVLHEVSVTDENSYRSIGVRSWSYDADREQVTISIDGHVLASRVYMLRIRFEGILRDDGSGFFRSAYDTVSDGKKWIVATQFQTTRARSAFPCYDEPHFRTPFNISIQIKWIETALSNMPVYYSIDLGQNERRALVHFQETPSMPTCSVAFFAGEFEQFDKTRPQAINVYSHLGRLYQIEYITKGSPELLRAMEDYTGIPYTMPELNLVATPILGSGQVNAWGLSTYQEKTLFVNHQSNSKSIMTAKMAVANAVASQWFGNLVSPAGWEFAWINKGLSTYLQYFVTAKVEPEWRLEHFFIAENQRPAMDLDQNLQIQPLNAPVIGPGDLDYNSADRFSKQKASAVMRMLNDWVGEDAFKKALNAYLTHNQYSSAQPEQLWNAFDNTLFDLTKSGLNGNSVRTVINTWTEQAGYPLVNVKKKDKSLVLTQQRFLSGFIDSNDTTKWFIRLSYTTNKEKNFDTKTAPTVWLDPSVNETIIPIDDDVEWYIFNIQSTGYYRVNYTEDNWLSLIKQLNDSPKDIHVLNRAQLIDDSFSLAKLGLLNYTIPMSISEYLRMEDDIIPWYSAMKSFDYIVNRMKRCRNTYMDVTQYIIKLASGALQKLNDLVAQKSPNRPTTIAWNALSTWMCKLQEYACGYQPALQYFQRWQNGEEISADIKDVAFCAGLRPFYYNPGTLDKLLTLYNTTKSYSERESVIKALPCADVQTLFTYLTLILENKCPIEPSDYDDFFSALSSTSNGITAMNDFLGKHFTDVVNNVKDGKNIAKTMFSILASKVSTDSEKENMMEMAFTSDTPVEFRNKLVPVYQNEVKDYKKWYNNGSPRTIWVHINPSAKGWPLDPSDVPTPSPCPTKDDSSASSRLHNYAVILQILALSVSVKFLVHVI